MYEVTIENWNKDVLICNQGMDPRQHYLDLYGDFKSKLPKPEIYKSPERSDLWILDFAKGSCGLKAHGAEQLIANLDSDLIGYAAPRVGHAAEAIAMLSEMYGKRAVFFAAASKEVSKHQAVVLGYQGCELRFAKIPAMPTLNAWIRKWAEKYNGVALPFGLANTPMVTAGLVKVCEDFIYSYGEPNEFWCAVSTGTMIRALEIGWPKAKGYGIAVARNIKDGEKGKSTVTSYHKTFYQPSDYMPEFKTTATYDAKAYKAFIDNATSGAVFINVGSDKQIESALCFVDYKNIKGQREWGNMGAFSYA